MATGRTLAEDQTAQLQVLEGRAPDTPDIPETPAANWKPAQRGGFWKARKESISLRVDINVLDWLQRHGQGYRTKINRILRERMEAEDR